MDTTSRTDSATAQLMEQILYEVKRVVVGQDRFLERVMVAMLAQGHLLVEGEELRKTSTPEQPTEHELLDLAERLYESRRRRDRMFTVKLFGEPAWDMLLALYYMPRRGIMLGVMSLGHAANIPPTTGVRWQKVLEEQGFIERGPKVTDSRQQLVRLTETGRALMSKYLIRLYYCNEGLPTF